MFIDSAPLFPITDSFSLNFGGRSLSAGKKALYLLLIPTSFNRPSPLTTGREAHRPDKRQNEEDERNILSHIETHTRFVHSLAQSFFSPVTAAGDGQVPDEGREGVLPTKLPAGDNKN
jgi:hypothetical protein